MPEEISIEEIIAELEKRDFDEKTVRLIAAFKIVRTAFHEACAMCDKQLERREEAESILYEIFMTTQNAMLAQKQLPIFAVNTPIGRALAYLKKVGIIKAPEKKTVLGG